MAPPAPDSWWQTNSADISLSIYVSTWVWSFFVPLLLQERLWLNVGTTLIQNGLMSRLLVIFSKISFTNKVTFTGFTFLVLEVKDHHVHYYSKEMISSDCPWATTLFFKKSFHLMLLNFRQKAARKNNLEKEVHFCLTMCCCDLNSIMEMIMKVNIKTHYNMTIACSFCLYILTLEEF